MKKDFKTPINLSRYLLCNLTGGYFILPVGFQLVVSVVLVEALAVIEIVLSHFVEALIVEAFREMAEVCNTSYSSASSPLRFCWSV